MCIMEMNSTQATDVMLQAMAHNASTIDRDADLARQLLSARGETKKLAALNRFQNLIHEAYALMLGEYGIAVAEVTADQKGHIHVGNERENVDQFGFHHGKNIIEEIKISTDEAHEFETR